MSLGEQKVRLGWDSTEFYVTPEGLDQIKMLVKQSQICPKCGNRTNIPEHMLVAKKCLTCIMSENETLKFDTFKEFDSRGRAVYTFVDSAGLSYTTTENYSDKPTQDTALSIETAGFKVPVSYKPFKATESVDLSRSNWTIYGKLYENSVVVLHYHDYYGKVDADFLAYKGSETVTFNRRSTEHKNMLEKARTMAQRTWKNKRFHIDGKEVEVIEDQHLLFIISTLESVMYDAQIQLFGTQSEEETSNEQLGETSKVEEVKTSKSRKRGNLELVAPEETPDAGV